jgi:adenylate kinase
VNAPPKVDWVCDKDGGEVVQREDDTPEAVNKRLELYERDTRPVLDFYDGLGVLVTIDGVGDPDEVFNRVVEALPR